MVSDAKYRTKVYLDTYLTPANLTKDDGATLLNYAVIYAEPNYPLYKEFGANIGFNRITATNGVSYPMYGIVNWPPAHYYNGKTYFVWQVKSTKCIPYINYYNHTTKAFSTAVNISTNGLTDDDHGAPIVYVDSSGYIHVIFGAHDSAFYYSKSTNVEDITAWTVKGSPASGTYPKLIQLSGGNLFLTYRPNLWNEYQDYRTSADGGTNWSAATTIINVHDGVPGHSTQRCYAGNVAYDSTNGRVHFAWVRFYVDGGNQYRVDVYHAYFKESNSHMYSMNGTDLGVLVDWSEAEANCKVEDTGTYRVCIPAVHLDSSNNPYIIFARQTGASTYKFRFAKWTGAAWTVSDITDAYSSDDYSDFYINSTTDIDIYLSRKGSGTATRGGDIEEWNYDGATFTQQRYIDKESWQNYRLENPTVPLNALAPFKLYYQEARSVFTSSDVKTFQYNENDNTDLIFAIMDPTSEPKLSSDKVADGYYEHVPIKAICIDKSGLTGALALWKAEAELRRITETYPLGSVRTFEKSNRRVMDLGTTKLHEVIFTVGYLRDATT